jgi:hypothetical protein
MCEEYTKEDAESQMREYRGDQVILDSDWQEQHMTLLADYVV